MLISKICTLTLLIKVFQSTQVRHHLLFISLILFVYLHNHIPYSVEYCNFFTLRVLSAGVLPYVLSLQKLIQTLHYSRLPYTYLYYQFHRTRHHGPD